MKKKVLTVAMMCATSLASISASANAAVTVLDTVTPADANGTTVAAMQSQCTALAAAHATADPQKNDIWTGTVVAGDVTWVSGPAEVGTHTFAGNGVGTQTGAGTFTPAHKDILGDPFRNGGSVNMFGIQEAVGGYYSASSYDFQNQFTSTYSHAFSCDISEQVWHPPVHHDQVGHYVVHPSLHGNDDAHQHACDAANSHGPGWPQWGENTEQCDFVVDQAAYDDPAYLDPDTVVANEAGTAVPQDQTDTLLAHESYGEGFSTSETLIIGQVVVCISPGSKGGAWKVQNGYTGSKCTTTWYNGGAITAGSNVNTGSHNYVTVPVV